MKVAKEWERMLGKWVFGKRENLGSIEEKECFEVIIFYLIEELRDREERRKKGEKKG